MKDKIEVIDFIKGFSIITIVLYHLLQTLQLTGMTEKAIQFGGTGIHAFILMVF